MQNANKIYWRGELTDFIYWTAFAHKDGLISVSALKKLRFLFHFSDAEPPGGIIAAADQRRSCFKSKNRKWTYSSNPKDRDKIFWFGTKLQFCHWCALAETREWIKQTAYQRILLDSFAFLNCKAAELSDKQFLNLRWKSQNDCDYIAKI